MRSSAGASNSRWRVADAFALRQRGPLEWLLLVAAAFTVLMVLVPLLVVVASWGSDQTAVWQHLIATQLSRLLRNSALLALGVGAGVTVLGVALAWLTVMCEFPGRRLMEWALVLPMAMPAYVLAFVVLGIFDFGGPLQQTLSALLGERFRFFDVRHDAVVITVLVLVLYPYVYLLARSAFLALGSDMLEAARIHGVGPWGAFFRVALPMARPAIAAGTALAVMEALADFGAVAVFNYQTFTTAIYKSWFGLFNLSAAAQLASLLMLFVALALAAEKYSRGRQRFVQGARAQHRHRYALRKPLAWLASALCALVLAVAFLIPLLQLLLWAGAAGWQAIDARYLQLLWHTLLLGGSAALLTVLLALLVAYARRISPRSVAPLFDVAGLGYALPGSVLAVGVTLWFVYMERQWLLPLQELLGLEPRQWLVGSVLALLAAYWVRFLAVANGPIESSIQRIRPSIPESARSLGAGSWEMLWRIYLPILRPGLITAGVLVFVDVMKEMPATLLLRPYGWDTLAVRIFEMTSEGEWQRAALPALTLVLIGLLPVAHAIKRSSRP